MFRFGSIFRRKSHNKPEENNINPSTIASGGAFPVANDDDDDDDTRVEDSNVSPSVVLMQSPDKPTPTPRAKASSTRKRIKTIMKKKKMKKKKERKVPGKPRTASGNHAGKPRIFVHLPKLPPVGCIEKFAPEEEHTQQSNSHELSTPNWTNAAHGIECEPWFHGPLSRGEARALLTRPGQFLVRQRPENGLYVLSCCAPSGQVCHALLTDEQNCIIGLPSYDCDKITELMNSMIARKQPVELSWNYSVPLLEMVVSSKRNSPINNAARDELHCQVPYDIPVILNSVSSPTTVSYATINSAIPLQVDRPPQHYAPPPLPTEVLIGFDPTSNCQSAAHRHPVGDCQPKPKPIINRTDPKQPQDRSKIASTSECTPSEHQLPGANDLVGTNPKLLHSNNVQRQPVAVDNRNQLVQSNFLLHERLQTADQHQQGYEPTRFSSRGPSRRRWVGFEADNTANEPPDTGECRHWAAVAVGLDAQPWFHPRLTRERADRLLRHHGDFLVRPSSTGRFVLSTRQHGHVWHINLVDREGIVKLGNVRFNSIRNLIKFSMLNERPIVTVNGLYASLETPIRRCIDVQDGTTTSHYLHLD